MSIPTLTPLGLYVAIKTDKQIVQIFKRDFTKTFFMLKEDRERESADENSSLNILSTVTITKSFDSRAFFEFENRLFARYGTRAAYEYRQLPAIEYVERMYDGIQIVHRYEDIVPDFYTREDTKRQKEKDFLPEHFLKGTQVADDCRPASGLSLPFCVYCSGHSTERTEQLRPEDDHSGEFRSVPGR